MRSILSEYRIHNADVMLRGDYEEDDLIDVIEGSRCYVPCIYAVNKIDQVGAGCWVGCSAGRAGWGAGWGVFGRGRWGCVKRCLVVPLNYVGSWVANARPPPCSASSLPACRSRLRS